MLHHFTVAWCLSVRWALLCFGFSGRNCASQCVPGLGLGGEGLTEASSCGHRPDQSALKSA
jgi:hypothetical protein